MTLEKAIERLSSGNLLWWKDEWDSDKDAIKLGIEALKRIKGYRAYNSQLKPALLPGETKE